MNERTDVSPVVLAVRPSSDPRVTWQARVGTDRARLEVIALVDLGAETIAVPLLSELELRALLAVAVPAERAELWVCRECGRANSPSRSWCERCSEHQAAVEAAS
jgi:ribosomal protein L40E